MANVSVVSIVGVAEIAVRHPGMVALIRVGEIAVLYVRSIHKVPLMVQGLLTDIPAMMQRGSFVNCKFSQF